MDRTRRTVLLTMLVFALQPVGFGAWLALIPHVKETLGLDKAQLAFALLGMPFGVIPGLQLAGWLISRFGPRRVLAGAFPLLEVALVMPLLATGLGTLFAALCGVGWVFSQTQIGLNTYAGRLEKNRGLVVMSRCHGFWALGVTAGSLMLALLSSLPPVTALLVIAVPAGVLGSILSLRLERFEGQEGGPTPPRRKLSDLPMRLAPISLVTLAVSMTEGAMSDWSAVYLAERLPEGAEGAGVAVSIFASCLAAGRFLGDFAKRRFGAVRLARVALGCAMAGLALLVVPLPLWTSYAGFALVGLGVSVGFPIGVSAAADLDHTHESQNIALLTTTTMIGFLVGPPLIGSLADFSSLRVGLAVLLPGLIAGIALSKWLVAPESGPNIASRG